MARYFSALALALFVGPLMSARSAEPVRTYPNSGGRLVCDRVRFVPALGFERDMVGGKFAGSNVSAAEGYEVLAEIKTVPPAGEWTEMSFDGKRPHRWLRYEAPPGSWGHISKLEFYAGKRRLNGPGFGSIGAKAGGRDWPRVLNGKDPKFKFFLDADLPDGRYVGIDTWDAATAVRPILDPLPGPHPDPLRVTLRSPTPDTTIRYTLDGTLPGPDRGLVYKDPIAIDRTTTLVAVSFKPGFAPSNATTGTYLVGADAKPALSTFHIGNSLTGTTGRFATYAQTAGKNHTYTSYLQPGILTAALWETDVMTTKERWEKTLASVTRAEHFTLQPRDPDIAHEAKYDILFFDVIRGKFPDVQPWIYAEWTNRARSRAWDRGTVPTTQMLRMQPALTWEESASNMLVYIEDLRDKVVQTYQTGKRPRIIPSVLAAGWIKSLLDQGKVPGLGPQDFDPIMFFDGVHPGPDGAYLIDLTWYAAFYRESPEGKTLPVNTRLTAPQAKVIERLAWAVVKNYPDCGLYEAGTTAVGKPEFSLAPMKLGAITRVNLSSSTPGAWFRYTLDGTTPSRTRGYVYCGVISVQPGTTVKAVAYKSGMADSSVIEAAYPSSMRPQPALPKLPENVILEHDVQYGQAGNDPLLLDILRPKEDSARPRPVVLYIHGGGWNAGDKAASLGRLLPLAASGEYVCASANYRLASQAAWPAQIHDCKAAVRWLKANAGILKIDPRRIGIIGESAGGHLVSMLGLTGDNAELEGASGSPGASSKVACVVDLCGPADFVTFNVWQRSKGEPISSSLTRLLGGPVEERPEAARQASPIHYVSSTAPPMLILHGTDDPTVPIKQAEDFYAALQKAGANATFVKVVGATHSIARDPQLWDRTRTFFAKYLRGEKLEISSAPIKPASQSKP